MKFKKALKLSELSDLLGFPFVGNPDLLAIGINEIHRVEVGDVAFVDNKKYFKTALNSNASVVLINEEVEPSEGKGIIICNDPFSAFNFLIDYADPYHFQRDQINPISKVDKSSHIHPSVYIAKNVEIGADCIIHPNVVIMENVKIGNKVIIQPGSIIGSHGFYYKKRPTGFEKLNSGGSVLIEDDVEIGANCTIDKGVTATTTIKKGTKIDNQVQVGHDTIIGENCLIAAHVGIAGCVNIGNKVTLWGQVGVSSGITIEDEVVVLAQSGVDKTLKKGHTYFGSPTDEARTKMKEMVALKQLAKR